MYSTDTIKEKIGIANTASSNQSATIFGSEIPFRILSLLLGALLGLSTPGFEQWYLAWFAFAPVIALSHTAKDVWPAGVRGWYFFTGYSLVCLSWLLAIRHELLEGSFSMAPTLSIFCFWFLFAAFKGMYGAIFCLWIKATPTTGGWLPVKSEGHWRIPAFVSIPFLWVMIESISSTPLLQGVPWTALEYSQYKQLPILQIASLVGSSGITVCIILVNLLILSAIGYYTKTLPGLTYASRRALIGNSCLTTFLMVAVVLYGNTKIAAQNYAMPEKTTVNVSAIQANLITEGDNVDSGVIYREYLKLTEKCPPNSIVIWPEWSFAVNFTKAKPHLKPYLEKAQTQKQSWILGCMDINGAGQRFNSVMAMDRDKGVIPTVYHKRFLVPFGEYTPNWVKYTPLGWMFYGVNKQHDDTASDDNAVCFPLTDIKVGPLLCIECLIPELSASNVRAGAQLLVVSSYTGWFHKSIHGKQLIAFCTLRAVENHRSFVFSTTLGPSAIIDSKGKILLQTSPGKAAAISADVPVENDITPFTRMCF